MSFNPRSIPLGPIAIGFFGSVMALSFSTDWAAGPNESWREYQTPAGLVTIGVGVVLMAIVTGRLRGLRDRWYFGIGMSAAAASILATVIFILHYKVIGVAGNSDPAKLDPTRIHAQSGLQASLVCSVGTMIIMWLHLSVSSALRSSSFDDMASALNDEERPLSGSFPVNLSGWIVASPA